MAASLTRARRRRARTAWLFLTPALLTLAIFTAWPLLQTFYLSLTNYDLINPAHWVGLANYTRMVDDPHVLNALWNTILYAVVVTPVTVALALALAIGLNRSFAGRAFVRTAVFLPFIVSLGIVSIAFSFLLDPNYGLVSHWLNELGVVSQQGILTDPTTAMMAIMAVGVWKNVGFYMVLYLAGLQSIPAEVYEAASLDGAGPLQRFRAVTWPLLSNQTMLVAIMAAIATLQVFDQIQVMTGGGPSLSTETLVVLIHREGFDNLDFGYGSAISTALLAFVLLLSLLQYGYFRRKQVTY